MRLSLSHQVLLTDYDELVPLLQRNILHNGLSRTVAEELLVGMQCSWAKQTRLFGCFFPQQLKALGSQPR